MVREGGASLYQQVVKALTRNKGDNVGRQSPLIIQQSTSGRGGITAVPYPIQDSDKDKEEKNNVHPSYPRPLMLQLPKQRRMRHRQTTTTRRRRDISRRRHRTG